MLNTEIKLPKTIQEVLLVILTFFLIFSWFGTTSLIFGFRGFGGAKTKLAQINLFIFGGFIPYSALIALIYRFLLKRDLKESFLLMISCGLLYLAGIFALVSLGKFF